MRILFFDTETTGLPKKFNAPTSDTDNWPRLVQLAYIVQDENGKTLHSSSEIICPEGFVIPKEASAVHGITTADAVRFGRALEPTLAEFLIHAKEADVIIGHNIDFDMHIIGAECYRVFGSNPLEGKYTMDTMKESTAFCNLPPKPGKSTPKWPRLQELHHILFGKDFDSAHNAKADIEATARCYWELCRIGVMVKP